MKSSSISAHIVLHIYYLEEENRKEKADFIKGHERPRTTQGDVMMTPAINPVHRFWQKWMV